MTKFFHKIFFGHWVLVGNRDLVIGHFCKTGEIKLEQQERGPKNFKNCSFKVLTAPIRECYIYVGRLSLLGGAVV